MKVKRLTELALLTALALIIFVIELQIPNPVPVPGVKLGLANIITVFAVYHYRAREVFLIVFVRILLSSFFSGNMMALMYSMAGGILCLVGMVWLKRIISERYIWLCSVLGAVLHNIGQITVARNFSRNLKRAKANWKSKTVVDQVGRIVRQMAYILSSRAMWCRKPINSKKRKKRISGNRSLSEDRFRSPDFSFGDKLVGCRSSVHLRGGDFAGEACGNNGLVVLRHILGQF